MPNPVPPCILRAVVRLQVILSDTVWAKLLEAKTMTCAEVIPRSMESVEDVNEELFCGYFFATGCGRDKPESNMVRLFLALPALQRPTIGSDPIRNASPVLRRLMTSAVPSNATHRDTGC